MLYHIKVLKVYCIPLFLLLFSCNTSTNKKEETGNAPTTHNLNVDVKVLDGTLFNKQILSNGKVEAKQRSDLRFKVSDELIKLFVYNGEVVKKGVVIAQLENSMQKNGLDKAQLEYEKAENEYKQEKINFGYGKDEDSEIPNHILKTILIKSGLREAQNNLENAKLLYDQTFLRAPFNGTVANLTIKEGNYITPSDVICTVMSNNKLEAVFTVMENDLSLVKLGQKVEVIPFANDTKPYFGKITEINPVVNEEGLVFVKASIANSQGLYDGMNIKTLINTVIPNTIVVPKEALVIRENKSVVFTINHKTAKWNYVTLAGENLSGYAVSEGLQPGDTIIVSGNQNLAHDAKVRINTFID